MINYQKVPNKLVGLNFFLNRAWALCLYIFQWVLSKGTHPISFLMDIFPLKGPIAIQIVYLFIKFSRTTCKNVANTLHLSICSQCQGKEKELKYTTCARLSGQKSVEIETLQGAFLRSASALHRCFFTLKGLCCVSPELQTQFDELLSWVRQSGSVTFKSEDEHSDSPDGARRKTDDFDNFMDEFEQELLAKPLDQTFNAEAAAPVENMDATFCVAVPAEAKKQRISPPRRPMEAPFRVKPYAGIKLNLLRFSLLCAFLAEN
jgi:hypothetical protein